MNKIKKSFFYITLILCVLMLCFIITNYRLYLSANSMLINKIKYNNQKNKVIPTYKCPRHPILHFYSYMLFDKDQNPITDEIFDQIISFNKDKTVFLVTKNNKKGLINNKGKYILPIKYTNIYSFLPDKNIIKATYFDTKNNKNIEILLDKDFKEILRAYKIYQKGIFFVVYDIEENIYKLYNSNFKIINSFSINPEILNDKYIFFKDSDGSVLLDINGKMIFSDVYKTLRFITEQNGRDYFEVSRRNTTPTYKNLLGIIDNENKLIVPCIFNYISVVNDGFWAKKIIKIKDENKKGKNYKRITKWAKYDFDGNYILNADLSEDKTYNDNKILSNTELNDKIPYRQIVHLNKHKENASSELLSLEEIKALEKEIKTIQNQSQISYIPEKPKPKNQPKHKTNYKSDFLSKKTNKKFTKLTCDLYPVFCKLSPNGLSAKYCGKESTYISNKELFYGKYYFEFQIINSNNLPLSKYTVFSMINLPKYNTKEDTKKIKQYWSYNKKDISLTRYDIKSKDIIGVAIDMNNSKVHFMINGEWKSNPYSVKNGTNIIKGKSYFPAFSIAGYRETLTVNFGKLPFKYNMPEGYRAIDK